MPAAEVPRNLNRRALLDWYGQNRRDLPWRRSRDPYAIWVSEVMLQQTQVASAVPYFEQWMRRYPTVESLAAADEQEALALWQGLGYYRRCRLLVEGACFMLESGIPRNREEWRKVPGVGEYTASAIASIAFGEPVAVVDGNVRRVVARLCGLRLHGAGLKNAARIWTEEHLLRDSPGDWNQALMELGATVCTPRLPKCPKCPVGKSCAALARKLTHVLPVPPPKQPVVHSETIVWIPYHKGAFGLRQIPPGRWWEGMWEFPGVPLGRPDSGSEGAPLPILAGPQGPFPTGRDDQALRGIVGPGWAEQLARFGFHVTNHRIRVDLWLIRSETRSELLTWTEWNEMDSVPMPSSQRKALGIALKHLGIIQEGSPRQGDARQQLSGEGPASAGPIS